MLEREKFFMRNSIINFSILLKKLTIIFICFYSNYAFSDNNILLESIENDWNNTQTMSGEFHQKLPNNIIVSGKFFIQKPHKSNFTYENNRQQIITSKFFINIIDNEGFLIDRYPIIDQPIYKLLSKDINFKKLFKFINVYNIDNEIIVEVSSKNDVRIKLIFNKADYSLKNWEIIDELGQSTYLQFTKIRKNISIDPGVFNIKEKFKY
jgi:outer membrane lipoprotein-sorting protein